MRGHGQKLTGKQEALIAALLMEGVAEVVAGHAVVRLDPQRLLELEDGVVGLALRQQDQSEVVGGFGRAWLQPQSGAAALGGAVEVAQSTVRLGQVGVIGSIRGVEGDGPADALGGLTVIALLMGDNAQQVQGVGVVGLGVEDIAVQPGCLGQAPALVLLQAEGKVVVHGDALRNADEGSGLVSQAPVAPCIRTLRKDEG
jgi:hypothetical protein